jgi:hypothetical protein
LRTAGRGVSEHVHLRSLVEQVEIGVDVPDFPTALRAGHLQELESALAAAGL